MNSGAGPVVGQQHRSSIAPAAARQANYRATAGRASPYIGGARTNGNSRYKNSQPTHDNANSQDRRGETGHASAQTGGSRHASIVPGNGNALDGAGPARRQHHQPQRRHRNSQHQTQQPDGDDTSDPDTKDMAKRRTKPSLMRSTSEHGLRRDSTDSDSEDCLDENGPRHGFKNNYQSEEIVSKLANVSHGRLCLFCFLFHVVPTLLFWWGVGPGSYSCS